jgi:hypothetical protein
MVTMRQTADLAETHVLLANYVVTVNVWTQIQTKPTADLAELYVLLAKNVVTEIALTPKRTKPIAVVADNLALRVKPVALANVSPLVCSKQMKRIVELVETLVLLAKLVVLVLA